ncbi:hypothetical protein [Pseudonocardia abyssalis]|uniref:Uncharacterized protein n=1 Tax=Pseudonocardia abyssalis TaxID=2792008 RepID=A0ABS6UU80_9PSEU|nr:hypothetical protein [Pseudonocardia abyssalis]MBW0114724.1 hypothetical protein [Pseudonocardia abyssalis]MBW0135814.1 hypothetical protein [Pseudonocardia abyssalis]
MTALRRRLPVLVGAVSAALAVAAVLLAVQSAPTETVAQARTHLTELVLGVAGAGEPVVGEGAACPWLGIGPTSRQVRPRVELHLPGGPTGVLDAAARSGEIVARGAAGVEVRATGGYVLTVRSSRGGEVVLVGESPCVWPSGTRTP